MTMGLILNPGSTSTKIAVFQGERSLFIEILRHTQEELSHFNGVIKQREFRFSKVMKILHKYKINLSEIEGVIAIGGLLKPGDAGVYEVNGDMINDLLQNRYGEHAANLGGIIARDIAQKIGVRAYIADPISTDEMQDVARLSGQPKIKRVGRAHTLNQKRIASYAARELGKNYNKCRLIVSHLGGGISVVAHQNGKMVDTNNARGEGPFSINRSGGLNSWELAKLCFSGKYTKEEVLGMLNGNGGIVAYLGTRDFREVENMKNKGDKKASLVFNALAYQVAKEIGSMATVLEGRVDAIVFTGGMANSEELVKNIKGRVSFIAPILVYPGERELEALADYLFKALADKIVVKHYSKEV